MLKHKSMYSKATVVGIPSLEDSSAANGSTTPSTTACSPVPPIPPIPPPPEVSARPASIHGNIVHNIYANIGGVDTPLKRPRNGVQSCGGQLNTSGLSQTSHHDLNSTRISPITRTASTSSRSQSFLNHSHGGYGGSKLQNNTTLKSLKLNSSQIAKFITKESGVKQMIISLALLCLISILLALLSLVFLLKISPPNQTESEDLNYVGSVYDATLGCVSLSLSLNLCCLLVCAIQFLFAVKLASEDHGSARTNKYLRDASMSRTIGIAGCLGSIPIFLTGIILYTFVHFDSTPAIVTAVLIGMGIVFIGAAVVHNVFVCQKEKNRSRFLSRNNSLVKSGKRDGKSFIGLPNATLDLSCPSNTVMSAKGLELSTLV